VRYEHLLRINDLERPDNPAFEPRQPRFGLLARTERPALFDATVDRTRVRHRDGSVLERELPRGSSTTRQTVSWRPEAPNAIGIGGGTDFARSVPTTAIDEPLPQALFLRCTYELRGPAVPADEAEQRALRQAYYWENLELVRRLRALAPGVL
jgi:hypothetical protein